jgi:adenylate cyclase
LSIYNINTIFDKKEVMFLLKSFYEACEIQSCLWVIGSTGQVFINYPTYKKTPGIFSRFEECLMTKTFLRDNEYLYSPIVINEECVAVLAGEAHEMDSYRLSNILKSISNLLVKQAQNTLERKEALQNTLDTDEEIYLLSSIGEKISTCLDIKQIAHIILLETKKFVHCENGSLMLINEERETLELVSAVGNKADENLVFKLGKGIAGIVAQKGSLVISNEVAQDHRFIPGKMKIHSLLCVPLKIKQKILGVINLSNKLGGDFTAREARLLMIAATQAAQAIENAVFYEQKLNEDRLMRNFERYLSPYLVKELMENKQDLHLGGVKKRVVVLFADIRSFTSLSEELEPEQIVKFLNEYFTKMVDIIFKYGGTIDKFVGDEIMAIFGAPITRDDDATRAVQAAIDMQKEVKRLEQQWSNDSTKAFSIGIGINSGEVIAGNIGSKKHMDYTVIGDAVNTAKRLESRALKNQILVSCNVFNMINGGYEFKKIGKVQVKGKKQLVEVFEVVY